MGYTKEQLERARTQDQEYLDRLKAIRKATGLNQEDFYLRYFKELENSINSKSAAQGKMKEIENGYEHASPAMLKIYAELGNCTLDELVYGESKKADNELPKVMRCADFIGIIDMLRKEGAIELELSQKSRKVYWGKDGLYQELPKELPVESVSIWIENSRLSFELKEYMQVISTEKINTLSPYVSEKLLKLWFDDMQKRNNTISGTKEGVSVTHDRQNAFRFGEN